MLSVLKKIIAFSVSAILAVCGFMGMTNNISDDYEEGKYKNVILMIGDGMSFNNLEATKLYRTDGYLAMEKMPVKATSDIDSYIIPATDSAAGGTALATGLRVWINSVAVYPFLPYAPDDISVPVTLCELAKANDMAAGVVTTDETSGATPSSFSAHTIARGNEKDISNDQLVSGIDLIWGGASESINEENTAANGYTYIDSETDMNALTAGSKSFAQFSFSDMKYCTNNHDTPTIEEMTSKAIEILSADEDGFFLMVEGACIDKHAHDNDMDNMILSAAEFDKAVAAALEFAEKDGETLVVVTADHGTGGMQPDGKGGYKFTHGSHDMTDVPVYVSAEDAGFISDVQIKNRQIPVQIARVLGFDKSQFPAQKTN
ncbi:MAG: alkaline phosphatase [Clostridia bacterium]|nr:alkaline phosphatase [Clostridia bacterium]